MLARVELPGYRENEEVVVHPGDGSEVGVLEDPVHDPHHAVGKAGPKKSDIRTRFSLKVSNSSC